MTGLPPNAQRQLMRMRSLDPPIDLVDSIMAEVEATPQVGSGPDLRADSSFVLAAAALILAVVVLLRVGAPNIGPAPTPVPLDQLPSVGQVAARISIDRNDVPATFGHGFLWLTNTATGELVRMDPANGSIASPVQVTEAGSAIPIAVTDTSVWVADSRDGTLVELDPASLTERRPEPGRVDPRSRTPVGGVISAIATDGSALWLLDAEAGQLRRLEADASQSLTVPITGSAVLVHSDSVWVADEGGGLVRIDPLSGEETGRVDVGVVATTLVANGESILVVGEPGDALVRVDIGSMEVAARGAPAMAASAQDGRVWAVLPSGHLVRLAPTTLRPVAASALDLEPSGTLAIGAGSLWATGVDAVGDAYLLELVPEQ